MLEARIWPGPGADPKPHSSASPLALKVSGADFVPFPGSAWLKNPHLECRLCVLCLEGGRGCVSASSDLCVANRAGGCGCRGPLVLLNPTNR